MMKTCLSLLLLFAMSASYAGVIPGPAQTFPSTEALVRKADLILNCRVEMIRGKERWRVVEVIKGDYNPKMFEHEQAGYIANSTGTPTIAFPSIHAGPVPKYSQEVLFVRLDHARSDGDMKWRGSYFVDEAFPVIEDKITYPATINWAHLPDKVERQFTVAEFIAMIRSVK